ncbi:unnamed protein product [Soboliphyme baturini]|uniref:UDP-N-acetylglucosamine transporter n=1 Tax=Soboliphyme baturini TaxID=241478 RepID=A0A183IIY7_9BILA|nr:unnamed protein product [Soboliphyme baturini]
MAALSLYKYGSLVVLVVQSSAMVLVLRYSRTMQTEGPRYLSSTAIVAAEVVKICSCFLVIFFLQTITRFSSSLPYSSLYAEIFAEYRDSIKVAVPAVLYLVQNNLLFLALSMLDAATYQVTYQLKILTTAVFSVVVLHKKLDRIKWYSLLLLMLGVAIVQYASDFCSGFSGVYLEKILKNAQTSSSLWSRNLQLALFSVLPGLITVYGKDASTVYQYGFFHGYNFVIWIVVLLQAYGGLLIALVVTYADNILKGFATSISIILSSVLSYMLLGDFSPSW